MNERWLVAWVSRVVRGIPIIYATKQHDLNDDDVKSVRKFDFLVPLMGIERRSAFPLDSEILICANAPDGARMAMGIEFLLSSNFIYIRSH